MMNGDGNKNFIYDISFIILTWNSRKYIAQCLESVDAISHLKLKRYVVDHEL